MSCSARGSRLASSDRAMSNASSAGSDGSFTAMLAELSTSTITRPSHVSVSVRTMSGRKASRATAASSKIRSAESPSDLDRCTSGNCLRRSQAATSHTQGSRSSSHHGEKSLANRRVRCVDRMGCMSDQKSF